MASNVIALPTSHRNINNEEFSLLFYGPNWRNTVWVTGFASPPDDKSVSDVNTRWAGGRWQDIKARITPGTNNYISIASVRDGGRSKDQAIAVHDIVLDDVKQGSARALKAEQTLGLPTVRVETSPDNEQWHYRLDPPETNLAKIDAIHEALMDLDLTDDDGSNAVRWARLPVGSNTKKEYGTLFSQKASVNHGVAFKTEDILALLGVPDLDRDWTKPNPGHAWIPPEDLASGGVFVPWMGRWGMLLGERTRDYPGIGRGHRLAECPWEHEHGTPGEDQRAAVWIRGYFKCQHDTCKRNKRNGWEAFPLWFNERLSDETGGRFTHWAQLEFEPVEPESIKVFSLFGDTQSRTGRGGLGDPWRKPEPPLWPGQVFPPAFETEMAKLAAQNGMDLGALGVCFMLAASGAADKRARLAPFAGVPWVVPPVLWAMLIGHSGNLKSPMMNLALRRLVVAHKRNMARYKKDLKDWNDLPKADRAVKPKPEPVALVVKNSTVESLQVLLGNNERGLIETRDELAGKFDFGQYSSGGQGAAERAFLMEAYEGEYHDVFRMSRTTYAESAALALLGGIQPDRLGDFKGLDKDGFIQRFISCVLRDAGVPDPTAVPDMTVLDDAIDRLLTLTPVGEYATDAGGEALIRETWERGKLLSAGPFLTAGFKGFSSKLHGTHARAALILHLMDGGQAVVIPRDTVMRAAHFTDFAQRQAQTFYFGLEGTAEAIAQSIASYLLRFPVPKLTTRLLKRNVWPCRKMSTKDMQIAVEPLIHDGWLEPENVFPSNKLWAVNPEVKTFSSERVAHEIERTDGIKSAMNPTREL